MSMSNYTETAGLDTAYHGVAHPVPAQIWVSLHTADPGEAAGANELAGNGYARVRVFRNAGEGTPYWSAIADVDFGGGVVGKEVFNSHDFEFPEFGAGLVGTITATHFATWDAAVGGNQIDNAQLATPQVFRAGSVPRFKAGQLRIQRR